MDTSNMTAQQYFSSGHLRYCSKKPQNVFFFPYTAVKKRTLSEMADRTPMTLNVVHINLSVADFYVMNF